MPDPNQDRPFDEEPLASSEPDKPAPPWEAEEEVEPEKEEVGAEPTPGFTPPVVEEVKEEVEPTEVTEEEMPSAEEPTLEAPPTEEAAPSEVSPAEAPPSEED